MRIQLVKSTETPAHITSHIFVNGAFAGRTIMTRDEYQVFCEILKRGKGDNTVELFDEACDGVG